MQFVKKKTKILAHRTVIRETIERVPFRFQLASPRDIVDGRKNGNEPLAESFEEMDLNPKIKEVLAESGFRRPTEIQAMAIPKLMQRKSAVIAAETGSGKSLAYMLPLVHNMFHDKFTMRSITRQKNPRAVILVPTRELALQVLSVLSSFLLNGRMRAIASLEQFGSRKKMEDPFDVLVTSPTRLLQLIEHNEILTSELKYMVIDEADSLFDSEFARDTLNLIQILTDEKRPIPLEYINIVSATITRSTFERIVTKNIHVLLNELKQRFILIRNPGNAKLEISLQILDKYHDDYFMVFCNDKVQCNKIFDYYYRHNLKQCGIIHGGVSFEDIRILICTDIAARGIDYPHCDHVLMFDFPRSPVDYLHRAGRTARVTKQGRKPGRVTSLVTRKDKVIARFIQLAIQRKVPVTDLTEDSENVAKAKIKINTRIKSFKEAKKLIKARSRGLIE
ncbi:DNA/RNA helicase, DEAD/DEAH box type domain-containing protein [Rozella allomycis CSF55]|uniref:DNA/RNA helicase, DEAD/DEAH box type domain-containing protein n=1 Tax=Rozella allomycis (strain CSF55) TaxID=988480 RepID=A0A075B3B4_ROZAC|nr:DNA/RNA helicase, DEAD/DEAH box type domain-containing protein [Rozella allomycis CSF55]|eukprot:EPZ36844.1 DNA/RNA helicase, DEAD/DEAH box type domain-containing protein [Rozella allomycis CSF55]